MNVQSHRVVSRAAFTILETNVDIYISIAIYNMSLAADLGNFRYLSKVEGLQGIIVYSVSRM